MKEIMSQIIDKNCAKKINSSRLLTLKSFLITEGFWYSSTNGSPAYCISPRGGKLGILYRKPETTPKFNFFGLKFWPRRVFLGEIDFSRDEHWILEVYGKKYIPIAKELAEKMKSVFNFPIIIRLVKEDEELEKYTSDYNISA